MPTDDKVLQEKTVGGTGDETTPLLDSISPSSSSSSIPDELSSPTEPATPRLGLSDGLLNEWQYKNEKLCASWRKWDKKIVTIIAKGSLITFSILEGLTISSLIYTLSLPFRAIPGVSIIADVASFYFGILSTAILLNSNIDKTIQEATEESERIVELNRKRIDKLESSQDIEELIALEKEAMLERSVIPEEKSRLKLMLADVKNVWITPASTGLSTAGLSFNPLLFISNIFRSFTIFFPAIFLAAVDMITRTIADSRKRKYENSNREFRNILMAEMSTPPPPNNQENLGEIQNLKEQLDEAFNLSRPEKRAMVGIGFFNGIATCGITIAVLTMFAVPPWISMPVGLLTGGVFGTLTYAAYRTGQKNTIQKQREDRDWLYYLATNEKQYHENLFMKKKFSAGMDIHSVYQASGMFSAILALVVMPIIHIGGTLTSVFGGLFIGAGVFIPNLFLHATLERKNRERKEMNDELTLRAQEIILLKEKLNNKDKSNVNQNELNNKLKEILERKEQKQIQNDVLIEFINNLNLSSSKTTEKSSKNAAKSFCDAVKRKLKSVLKSKGTYNIESTDESILNKINKLTPQQAFVVLDNIRIETIKNKFKRKANLCADEKNSTHQI